MGKSKGESVECDQLREFVEKQAADLEAAMKRLSEQHREKVALYEKQFLQQKHQRQREHETAVVEMEKRQLLERNQLEQKQLKEKFILQRQLLMTRQVRLELSWFSEPSYWMMLVKFFDKIWGIWPKIGYNLVCIRDMVYFVAVAIALAASYALLHKSTYILLKL